ncbi:MAG TPA: pyridoxal phosphate-dependent aminotransferase [Clostridiaceae bacterium]
MQFSKDVEQIAPSLTLSIVDRAKKMRAQGIDVISFGAGEPDFDTPNNIKIAAIKAINDGMTKYTASSGIVELKLSIANKFAIDNNLIYSKEQIIVSAGAKQSLFYALSAILNPGDEVLISVPFWLSYPALVTLSKGVPILVNSNEATNYKYDLHTLNNYITSKTKVLILNTPNNPTGSIYSIEELIQIAEFAKEKDLIIISDEIYEKLIYDGKKHISIASLSEDAYRRTIVINGVSKTYAMTGWRIGYAAASEEIIKLMTTIQSHCASNPNTIAQYAALEALSGDQSFILEMVGEFEKRRNYMIETINKIDNVNCIRALGAFYIMMDISKILGKSFNGNTINNSVDFSNILLENYSVAVVPGVAFGMDNFVRLSYAASMDNIIDGLGKISTFLHKIC